MPEHLAITFDGSVIPAARVRALQIRHFGLCYCIPVAGTIAAFVLAARCGFGWTEGLLFAVGWIVTGGLGISVGLHRYFTHRSFETRKSVRAILAVFESMAAQGPLLYWVALHRRHHECSDSDGDPHSPLPGTAGICDRLGSLWHGHIGWVIRHEVPNPRTYAPDVLKDPIAVYINLTYLLWVALGFLLPAAIGGFVYRSWFGALSGALWGGCARIAIGNQLTWSVNSICHRYGSQRFDTHDQSRNNSWLAVPTFGEAWPTQEVL